MRSRERVVWRLPQFSCLGSTQTGQTTIGGRVSFRAVHFVSIAVQPFRWMCCSMVCVSSGPDKRNARTKARRRSAASMQSFVSCTHAPRPGIVARSSRTSTESMDTTLRRADREARVRHPTHVRTGSMLHPRLGDDFVRGTPGRPAPRRSRPVTTPRCCRAGCRSSRRSAWPRGVHSDPLCRWRGRADSRVRAPVRPCSRHPG